ncbi:MAG: hypothetical protein OEY14_18470 [Myxococcales bacterium]|nr:hypothetical protein [Myxococcales bacterium]
MSSPPAAMAPEALPEWAWPLAERAGPFGAAASRFLARFLPQGLPSGPEGLVCLAARIDDFVHDLTASEADEEAFIEGGGALLALLILGHLDGATHRARGEEHRLSLGRRGFFDPFAALEAALEAERPRAELRAWVERAEAEARGEGPIARIAGAFEDVLALRRPELLIVSQFGLELSLGDGLEVDLARLRRSVEGESEDQLLASARKLVDMIPGGDEDSIGMTDWEEARRRLLPRLVPERFVEELRQSSGGRSELHAQPIGHGILRTLVLSYEGRSRYLRRDEVLAWGRSEEELEAAWLARLAARSQQARFAAVETPRGAMVVARSGDGLDSSRLLLPGLRGVLEAELEPPFLVAIPHRDALLAVSGQEPALVAALRARAREDHARAPHPISPELFELRASGPRPWS